jgi:hypothetical protein
MWIMVAVHIVNQPNTVLDAHFQHLPPNFDSGGTAASIYRDNQDRKIAMHSLTAARMFYYGES